MRLGAPGCLKIGLIFGEGSVKAPNPCKIPAFQENIRKRIESHGQHT